LKSLLGWIKAFDPGRSSTREEDMLVEERPGPNA